MMSRTRYEAANHANETTKRLGQDQEIREAVNRVYQKYGNDLSTFYRDMKKSVQVEKCESPPKRHGTSD